MPVRTHEKIDQSLCGTPILVEEGRSEVRLESSERMAADASGLVHGGFVFGLADYAAMLAVNHPSVVLGGAEVRFLKPTRAGAALLARAEDQTPDGKKHLVKVEVFCEDALVFTGTFTCFVPERHVLAGA